MDTLEALSVLDGRYAPLTAELHDIFSECGLIRKRVFVEIQWFTFLSSELKLFTIPKAKRAAVAAIATTFDAAGARAVKKIEKTTNHDVKAVEYYIKGRLDAIGLRSIREWVHFGCTSEDINNTAYALMLAEGRQCVLATATELLHTLEELAVRYKAVAMMSRTHGQPATPTTVGKEFVNFCWRIRKEITTASEITIQAKLNGATGNYNAHVAAFPDINWLRAGERFISEYLALEPLLFTTQINPNHYISELMHSFSRLCAVLIDLDRDMWGYISLGYFTQKLKKGEVGSSTMPHKVNPIDFENGEGNCGLAIALMDHLAIKLLQSRFQRDLTDSTVLRNLGAILGYALIGMKNTLKGLMKIELCAAALNADLDANQELLAEPIQTVMRVYGEKDPYEKLKKLTRGVSIDRATINAFIDSLPSVPVIVRRRMKRLTPQMYIGLAARLVDEYFLREKQRPRTR